MYIYIYTPVYVIRVVSTVHSRRFERFGSEALVEAQKRHRPVTVCCTFRPDTGMIS